MPRAVLERFFDQLGPERAARIEAVSLDLGPRYQAVTVRHRLTNGRIEALNSTVRLLSHRARGFRPSRTWSPSSISCAGGATSSFPPECTESPN